MSTIEAFPLPQVAFVLGETVDEVKKTVDYNKVDFGHVVYRGRRVRALDFKTIVFLAWAHEHKDEVKPLLRLKLYSNLKEHSVVPRLLRSGDVSVRLDSALSNVKKRVDELRKIDTLISENEAGEKILNGTEIEVYRIAALLEGGMSVDDVLRDYPSMTKEQVVTAKAYADIYPKLGRPYPRITAKAAMDQIDFSALELD